MWKNVFMQNCISNVAQTLAKYDSHNSHRLSHKIPVLERRNLLLSYQCNT